jgi:glutamate/tyrosine decarboxylase-like PLP-dependent enzyme
VDAAELEDVLSEVPNVVRRYLAELDERSLVAPGADDAARSLGGPLPERGDGALSALRELASAGIDGSVASSGPRMFHFVTGGVTPAALGADWLASALDQNGFSWVGSPLSGELERISVSWLLDLFELPESWGGVLTTGATMANFVALGAARRWWGERHGTDVDADGLAGLPPVPVFSSGYVHATAYKALGMLGVGRGAVRVLAADDTGRLDVDALRRELDDLEGAPAILIANAGDVNAGAFDPIEAMADLAEGHGAWLHVDGAFGLFARVTPRTAELAAGIERADSVIADGHKWLNVPYDCGFTFLKDPDLLARIFVASAAYLPEQDPARPNFGLLTPESSRRARSLAVWATLRAYGRSGYRTLVERNLDHARLVQRLVEEADDLELLDEVRLNIVPFRYSPPGSPESALDGLNARLGDALLADGRVFAGTTRYRGKLCFRPAFVNWRTRERDAELLVDVVRELGAEILKA